MNNSSTRVSASPDQILRSNARSFDRGTNQTASRYVNPPTKYATAQIFIVQKGINKINIHQVKRKENEIR